MSTTIIHRQPTLSVSRSPDIGPMIGPFITETPNTAMACPRRSAG